jgi:hypothetical protein
MNETQRCGVDAIAQAALLLRAVIEDVSEMAVAVHRTNFRAYRAGFEAERKFLIARVVQTSAELNTPSHTPRLRGRKCASMQPGD